MENITYLLFFLSIISILFIIATMIVAGDLSFNAGFRQKISLILVLSYLSLKCFLWLKNENQKDN